MVRHDTETEKLNLFCIPPEFHFIQDDFGDFIILKIWRFIGSAYGYEIDVTAVGVIEIFKVYFFSAAGFFYHNMSCVMLPMMVRSGNETTPIHYNRRARSPNGPLNRADEGIGTYITNWKDPVGPVPRTGRLGRLGRSVRLGNGPYSYGFLTVWPVPRTGRLRHRTIDLKIISTSFGGKG